MLELYERNEQILIQHADMVAEAGEQFVGCCRRCAGDQQDKRTGWLGFEIPCTWYGAGRLREHVSRHMGYLSGNHCARRVTSRTPGTDLTGACYAWSVGSTL